MNYYPEQLRRIAVMCEALDRIDSPQAEGSDAVLHIESIEVIHPEAPDQILGTLVDEIGGGWSFRPVGGA